MPQVIDANARIVVDAFDRVVISAEIPVFGVSGIGRARTGYVRQTATAAANKAPSKKKPPRFWGWLISFWR
jgi:hypothetical protein